MSRFVPFVIGVDCRDESRPTRVAVTATKDFGQTDCLIANYNRPVARDWGNFEREESENKDMKIWEAALATSASPFYLPPFFKKETKTDYIDGTLHTNCPAQVGYEETLKIWPDHGTEIDILLSLGTGMQKQRGDKAPTMIKFGGFSAFEAMFDRQLSSQKSRDQFLNSPVSSSIKSKLYRLDPPNDRNYVKFYDHQKIPDLVNVVTEWSKLPEVVEKIQDIANKLVASLFFYEPNPKAASTPQSLLGEHSHDTFAGSIRCRLGHETAPLNNLLLEKVESFWYVEVISAGTEDLTNLPSYRWALVVATGSTMPSQMTVQENGVKKFRLNHTFQVDNDSNLFQVLAVKLKGSEKRYPISGFPSTLADLRRREKMEMQ